MHHLKPMLDTHPAVPVQHREALIKCLEACSTCIDSCLICADACLAEKSPEHLRRCIRLNLDCADICDATWRVLARQNEPDLQLLRRQLDVCALACHSCGEECQRHASMHLHCKVCAEGCKSCEASCRSLAEQLAHSV